MKKFLFIFLIFSSATALFAYSQFIKKETIQAVLQYQIDLENPPDAVFAISTFDQKLNNGKNIPRGTRFLGMLVKEEDGLTINFDTLQSTSGKKEKIMAKSLLNVKGEIKTTGVSAKISMTIYERTQTNILGAIFKGPNDKQNLDTPVLPQGFIIKIEID